MNSLTKKIRLNLISKLLLISVIFEISSYVVISNYSTVLAYADTTIANEGNIELIKNKILTNLQSYKTDIEFSADECTKLGIVKDTETDPKHIYFDLLFEHPEIFWTSLDVTGVTYKDDYGNKSYTLYVSNIYDNSEIESKKAQLNSKISEIINKFSSYNDLRKVYEIHDYINQNCSYNYNEENVTVPSSAIDPNSDFDAYIADQRRIAKTYAKHYENHSIYGVLINGQAVCEGYSKSAKLLFNKSGIESEVIRSSNHGWNYVKINGNYYEIDLTWDDRDDEATLYPYMYFNITNNEILKDINNAELHTALSNNVPNCTDTSFDNIFRNVDNDGNINGKNVVRIEDKLYYINNSMIYSCDLDGRNPSSVTTVSSNSIALFNLLSYNNNLYVGDFEYDNNKMTLYIKKIDIKNNKVETYLNINNEFNYNYDVNDDTLDMNFYIKNNKTIVNLTQYNEKVTKEF